LIKYETEITSLYDIWELCLIICIELFRKRGRAMRKVSSKTWYIFIFLAVICTAFSMKANAKDRKISGIYAVALEDNPYNPESLNNPLGQYDFGYRPEAIQSPYALYNFKYTRPNNVPNPFLPGGSEF